MKGSFNMRTLHLYEFEWMDKSKVIPENVLAMGSNAVGIRKLACSHRATSNADITHLYNYLYRNGNCPYMTELPNGDIRIQYFKKG